MKVTSNKSYAAKFLNCLDAEIGQVRNLRVQVVGADSAQVDWDPPVMSIPKSLRYKFFYRRLNTASDEEEIQSVVNAFVIFKSLMCIVRS